MGNLTQVSRVLLMDEGEAEELQVERTLEKESSRSNGEKAGRTKEAGETLGLLGTQKLVPRRDPELLGSAEQWFGVSMACVL